MRILLDENTPRQARGLLPGHDVRTAPEMGWAGISNGQLLDQAEKAGFDALITGDQNIAFQQNLAGRTIAVIILSTNIWPIIRTQPQTIRRAVAAASAGSFTLATFRRRPPRPRPTGPTC